MRMRTRSRSMAPESGVMAMCSSPFRISWLTLAVPSFRRGRETTTRWSVGTSDVMSSAPGKSEKLGCMINPDAVISARLPIDTRTRAKERAPAAWSRVSR